MKKSNENIKIRNITQFLYNSNRNKEIIEFEEKMLREYSIIIDDYRIFFERYGCSLRVGMMWNNKHKTENWINNRIPIEPGYQALIFLQVLKDGKFVCVGSTEDPDVHYYLGTDWQILEISRGKYSNNGSWKVSLKHYVRLFSDTSDIKEEVEELMGFLSNYPIINLVEI